MKTRNKFFLLAVAVLSLGFSACSDFLDEQPDNRTVIDTEDKVVNLLVSAYSEAPYIYITELSSDNVDECGVNNPSFDLIMEQAYNWREITETDNEDPMNIWNGYYNAIASANMALQAIEKLGGPTTVKLKAAWGEALVCRAYAHFMLVNVFCQAYNPQYSEEDLGVPYMEDVENDLFVNYERGSVAEVYDKIDRDLVEGLPLINDVIYSTPKYHFNQKAAYAFASRFYLFYQKWDRAIECANKVLGTSPQTMLRDMAYLSSLQLQSVDRKSLPHILEYINAQRPCNLLLQTGISQLGVWTVGIYGGSPTGFAHTNWLDKTETFNTTQPWGKPSYYENSYSVNDGSQDKTWMWRLPYKFEYSDPVNQIGYAHTVYPAFTAEETLLIRAEAYIMKKLYGPALEDMNLWVSVYARAGATKMTEASISAWVRNTGLYQPATPTPVKEIKAPAFPLEPGTQTDMCYALLQMRRYETVHMGLRWFDVKRYGITIYRRKLTKDRDKLEIVTGVLNARDPRSAIQLPPDVIAAGMTPNPR